MQDGKGARDRGQTESKAAFSRYARGRGRQDQCRQAPARKRHGPARVVREGQPQQSKQHPAFEEIEGPVDTVNVVVNCSPVEQVADEQEMLSFVIVKLERAEEREKAIGRAATENADHEHAQKKAFDIESAERARITRRRQPSGFRTAG